MGLQAVPMKTMNQVRDENISTATHFTLIPGLKTSKKTLQFLSEADHPIGPVTQVSPCSIKSSNALVTISAPQPQYGRDTKAVLIELGYKKEEIESMLDKGVVAENWSKDYLVEGDPWAAQAKAYQAYINRASKL